ncbi:MAG: carboxypeptidase-like regulatory domain-containing protein [archaeon]
MKKGLWVIVLFVAVVSVNYAFAGCVEGWPTPVTLTTQIFNPSGAVQDSATAQDQWCQAYTPATALFSGCKQTGQYKMRASEPYCCPNEPGRHDTDEDGRDNFVNCLCVDTPPGTANCVSNDVPDLGGCAGILTCADGVSGWGSCPTDGTACSWCAGQIPYSGSTCSDGHCQSGAQAACGGDENQRCIDSGGTAGCQNLCSDGIDNEGDGCTDGIDSACGGNEDSDAECGNSVNDDCDAFTDCDDPGCKQTPETFCSDGCDNDEDSCTDAWDVNCGGYEYYGGGSYCYDGGDSDCDGLIDADDPDCVATFTGRVTDIEITDPIQGATVYAAAWSSSLSRSIEFTTTTDINGDYSLDVYGDHTYDVSASASGYEPKVDSPNYVNYADTTAIDFELKLILSVCSRDCTFHDVCDISCDGEGGCYYYNDAAKTICSGRQPDFEVEYNSSHMIRCCKGTPYIKPVAKSVSVEINSNNIVTTRRVVIFRGKPITMVINIFD